MEPTHDECIYCHGSGFRVSYVKDDGTEMMALCSCHPLVRARKAKQMDGQDVIGGMKKIKKGVYEPAAWRDKREQERWQQD